MRSNTSRNNEKSRVAVALVSSAVASSNSSSDITRRLAISAINDQKSVVRVKKRKAKIRYKQEPTLWWTSTTRNNNAVDEDAFVGRRLVVSSVILCMLVLLTTPTITAAAAKTTSSIEEPLANERASQLELLVSYEAPKQRQWLQNAVRNRRAASVAAAAASRLPTYLDHGHNFSILNLTNRYDQTSDERLRRLGYDFYDHKREKKRF